MLSRRQKPRGPAGPPGPGAGAPGGSQHRHGAEPLGLELAGQLMGQLRRNEAGLFDRQAAAAIEDHVTLGIGSLDPAGIHEHRQLADLAAGREGGHHEEGEGHPRQAPAVATWQGRLAEAVPQVAPGPILSRARRLGQR